MSCCEYRFLFAKTEAMRFTGHLDLQRAWERLCRRAALPVSYSAGYHPHAKIQIGAALPLGVTGDYELVDIRLEEERPVEVLTQELAVHAPPGLTVLQAFPLSPASVGLEKLIVAGDYLAEPLEGTWPEDLPQRIAHLLASPALVRERRGKQYDLRPRILEVSMRANAIYMRLRLEPNATGRPDEVLAALGLENAPTLVRRARLLLKTVNGGFLGSEDSNPPG